MEKITFQCETITPMFLAGADGKTPELRPPSIKAAMRFWWRAMNGHLPLKDLKKKEAEIFGGSGENEGRSKFNIRVTTKSIIKENSLREKIWDNDKNSVKQSNEGEGYLFYSTIMQNDNQRPFISKLKFDVDFSSNNINILNEVAETFFYFSLFGALGSRSRRGAGNFFIYDVKYSSTQNKNLRLPFEIDNKNDLKEYLEQILNNINSKNTKKVCNNNYSNFTSTQIYVLDKQSSIEKCLELLGKSYRNFRSYKNPDYTTVKHYLLNNLILDGATTIEKAALGLPINYRYRSLKGASATIEGSNKKERERSASPLFFKILPIKNGNSYNYFPLVIYFNRLLLPQTDKVKLKKMGKNNQKPLLLTIPTNQIIQDFIQQLPNALEVKL